MNKRRGILIVSIAVAAAIGLFIYMRRGDDRPSSAQTAKTSSQTGQRPASEPPKPAELIVTVIDDNGPVAAATVRFERERGDVEIVEAGTDGVARGAGLEPGTWRVSASADGHEPAALRERELQAGEVVRAEITLALGGRTLSGTVTDAMGGPIAGARIDAAKLAVMTRPSDAIASTLSGSDGKYKLTVAAGQLLVAASEASYAPQSRFVEVGAAGAIADFQLVPGGVIEGIVRDEQTREPVSGARVIADRDSPSLFGERAQHAATTGNDGRFRVGGLRPGAYELRARAANRASPAATIVGLGVAEQVTDVEILVGNAPVIRGVVLDENGKPAPNVDVSAYSDPGEGSEAKSDAMGAFVLDGLATGRYTLMGRSDDYLPAEMIPVELAGKDVNDVTVKVRHGLKVKGHVERRQICSIEIAPDEDAMARGTLPMLFAPVTTGPDGAFEIGPVNTTGYELTARCPSGEQGGKQLEVKPGMPEIVVEVKPGASIAGTVVDGKGKPIASVTVMGTSLAGMERTMIVNGMVTSGVQVLTNAAGAYELRGLHAGSYRLRVLDRGRPLPTKTDTKVTLTAVEHKTGVTLAVDRPDGVIRGVVTDSTGKPIKDAWVSLHQDLHDMLAEAADRESSGGSRMVMVESSDSGGDSGGTPPALTDDAGRFEIKNIARVPWTVIAEAQGGKLRGRAMKVVPDADIKLQALALTELEGKVIAAGAMPTSFQVQLDGPTHAQRSFASKDGTFSFARIDPGDYTVTVTSSGGNGRATVRVVAEQTATVEIALAANAIVIGKLTDPSGKPLAGIPVTIIPDSGDGRMRVELHGAPPTSGPDGTFRLEAKAGPSILMVLTPGRPTSRPGLKLEAGQTLDVGTITVADAPGAPGSGTGSATPRRSEPSAEDGKPRSRPGPLSAMH